jgi:putative ABC transport system permease protein
MLKSYFKIALRNILKNRTYSFINIFGLSIGLASAFIILIYIFYQLSYDKYNENLDNIFLVIKPTDIPAIKGSMDMPLVLGP